MATGQSAGRSKVLVHHDQGWLCREAGRLDELQQATSAPVTARRTWQQTWLRWHPEWRLVTVTVERDGRLDAAAVLARRPGAVFDDVRLVGSGASDEVRFPARDEAAAGELAVGIAAALDDLGRPWRLRVRDLPPGDAVAARLTEVLPRTSLTPGDVSPRLALGAQRTLRAHVSRNHHQQSRRLLNRIARDGYDVQVQQLSAPGDIAAAMPEIERVCRARDDDVRRHSALDSPAGLGFFRDVVAAHADRGEAELTVLRLDGRLAAYDLCFRDGRAWRMWNCRFDPAFAPYGPGRLSHDASLAAALRSDAVLYDWMRGAEAYKRELSDQEYRVEDLHGTSGPVLWAVADGPRRCRAQLRDLKDSQPVLARAWGHLRPVLVRLRHARSR